MALLAKLLPVYRTGILLEILQYVGRNLSLPGSMRLVGCFKWRLVHGVSWSTDIYLFFWEGICVYLRYY